MFEKIQQLIDEKIIAWCKTNDIVPAPLKWSAIPFSGEWGISTSFFQTAADEARAGKEKKLPVPQRAQEIAEQVKVVLRLAAQDGSVPGISRVEAVKGYLNLYFVTSGYARQVVDEVLASHADFGRGAAKQQRLMVEFSQPNTHKAFHVGHLRSAILGDSLAHIVEFAGYDLVRANYPGDMGLHVIRWLWAYLKYHNGEEPETDITHWMGMVYADATKKLEEDPALETEVRALYTRWDKRDPEVEALWKKTRQWSLDGFNQMYEMLGITFDKYYFNSEEEQPGKEVVADLIQRNIAVDERPEGPVIVKLDELLGNKNEKFRVLVILRSDGTALYATEDLSLVMHKFRDYPDLARSIYVVDVRQSLHFTQVFKTLEIAGYEQAKKCVHVAYELVTLPGNVVMSSREGTVVLLENLIREAIERAREETKKKNPNLDDAQLESVAKAIGLGALKYPLLARENAKVVTFDWQSALDFNGQAAPYIQYAHVRCNSILRKANVEMFDESIAGYSYELDPAEIGLIELISRFPSEVQRAAEEYKPLIIASIAYEIARAFASFYDKCPVIQAEDDIRNARLQLVMAAKQTMSNALKLLGIQAPDVM
ncbi:MAG TPA: arginine--tRNA ligase [Anaerolineales bacterium]|nr:arginine--tRNA ligase [Anaerolineales bacterium]